MVKEQWPQVQMPLLRDVSGNNRDYIYCYVRGTMVSFLANAGPSTSSKDVVVVVFRGLYRYGLFACFVNSEL